MDGLECSEIYFHDLRIDNEKYRMDSEFFKKEYLNTYKLMKSINHSTIGDECQCLTDFHANGSYETIATNFKLLDDVDYAYMVRTTDLEQKNYSDNVKYISKHSYEFLAKSKVFGGEVLINKIGSPGRCFLMPKFNKPVSLGMNLFMLRMKENSKIKEPVLWLFLNTSVGKNIINRKINGTVPLSIDKMAIKSIYIPVFNDDFQKELIASVEKSEELSKQAICLYDRAQSILEQELGYADYQEPREAYSEKSFSEVFGTVGRMDPEYYQKRYDDLFDKLSKVNTCHLSEIVKIKKSIEPGSEVYCDDGIPFVRVSDLSKYGISEPSIQIPRDVVPDIEALFLKKDTILLSKDGSVGIAYKVDKDYCMITSSALLHLSVCSDLVLSDYLTLVLNSKVVQMQAERDSGGSIIQHWKPSSIEQIRIPLLDIEKQKQLSDMVQKSFELRKQSEQLLSNAIEIVEAAIEQGELEV